MCVPLTLTLSLQIYSRVYVIHIRYTHFGYLYVQLKWFNKKTFFINIGIDLKKSKNHFSPISEVYG